VDLPSGLLVIPAAISLKFAMPRILTRFGYRAALISNTIVMGLLLLLFATIGSRTPVWMIVLLAFSYGASTSLQFTSINALADVAEVEASMASFIATTVQQISISFGVASAGLATAFFIPVGLRSNPVAMIRGTHQSFIALVVFTLISTIVFARLSNTDSDNVTRRLHGVVRAFRRFSRSLVIFSATGNRARLEGLRAVPSSEVLSPESHNPKSE
jgi:predicted MFS family arabinose efflux permease